MAIFNEILEGRYNRALQKKFAIKGSPPVRQVGGEIMPVHVIHAGPEDLFLESWSRWGIFNQLISGVGQFITYMLRNPKGSNIIAVVEGIWTSSPIAQQFDAMSGLANQDGTSGTVPAVALDIRVGTTVASNLIFSSQLGPPPQVSGFARRSHAANADIQWFQTDNQFWVLPPGVTLVIKEVTGNSGGTGVTIALQWHERALTESEKQ